MMKSTGLLPLLALLSHCTPSISEVHTAGWGVVGGVEGGGGRVVVWGGGNPNFSLPAPKSATLSQSLRGLTRRCPPPLVEQEVD